MGVSDILTDGWFYTANGERIGPVGIGHLRELAEEKKLHPRLDLCWTKGMDEWLPAGEIDGLFEKKRSENTEQSQSSETSQVGASKRSEGELKLELLNAKWPGASRRVYLFAIWVLPALLVGGVALLGQFFLNPEDAADAKLLTIASVGAGLLMLGIIILVSVQRFDNLGMSGWWILGHMVPLLNLWVGYRAVCCPAGYEFHRKMDGIGIFLAILYGLPMILFMIMIVLVIILLLGQGSGAMFEGMEEVLENLMQQFDESEAPQEE